jgi:hypothetical protein
VSDVDSVSRPVSRPIPVAQTRALRQAILRTHETTEALATHEPADAFAGDGVARSMIDPWEMPFAPGAVRGTSLSRAAAG